MGVSRFVELVDISGVMTAQPHITEEDYQLFNDSFERCLKTGVFFDHFYARLLTSYPEMKILFAGTDLAVHKRKLRAAVYLCLSVAWDEDQARGQLVRLGAYHQRLGIAPSYYALWLESLLGAAWDCDALFTDRIDEAWRLVLQPGIEAMQKAA